MVAADPSATLCVARPIHPMRVMQPLLVRDILRMRQPDSPRVRKVS